MFPLYDDNPTEITPIVTIGLIATTVAVWVLGTGRRALHRDPSAVRVRTWERYPRKITGRAGGPRTAALPCAPGGFTWEALLTSMFLHGGWMHLIGNMWFLWVFGNNIEDSMGHLRFLVFYVLTGLIAAGAQVAFEPASAVPIVGASGAVSGIMGAYLLLYPRVRVHLLVILVIFIRVFAVPAWLMLVYWFGIQLVSAAAAATGAMVGVAFWAHVGGFVAGLALVKVFENPTLVNAKRSNVRLARSDIPSRGVVVIRRSGRYCPPDTRGLRQGEPRVWFSGGAWTGGGRE